MSMRKHSKTTPQNSPIHPPKRQKSQNTLKKAWGKKETSEKEKEEVEKVDATPTHVTNDNDVSMEETETPKPTSTPTRNHRQETASSKPTEETRHRSPTPTRRNCRPVIENRFDFIVTTPPATSERALEVLIQTLEKILSKQTLGRRYACPDHTVVWELLSTADAIYRRHSKEAYQPQTVLPKTVPQSNRRKAILGHQDPILRQSKNSQRGC
jgi:hypothetical protein